MPFEIKNQGDLIFARLYGVVTPDDLKQFADDAEAIEESISTARDRITDLTAVERFDIGFPAMNALALRRRVRRFSRPVKSAIIVQDLVQVGMARMFQTLNDNPQIEIRILRSVAEAKKWFEEEMENQT